MKLVRLSAAALIGAFAAAPLRAGTIEDNQVWVNLNALGAIKDRLVYYAEIQPRFYDRGGEIGQVIARGALGWKLSDRVSLFQGYAHIAEPNDLLPEDRNEERSFQQLSWDDGRGPRGRLASRTRFEQRWRSDGPGVQLRVRSFLRYTYPIGRGPMAVRALVSAEPFVIVKQAGWGSPTGFDQFRSNVALEFPLTGRTSLEVGYLNQYQRLPGDNAMNHIAQVVLNLRP